MQNLNREFTEHHEQSFHVKNKRGRYTGQKEYHEHSNWQPSQYEFILGVNTPTITLLKILNTRHILPLTNHNNSKWNHKH